MTQTHLKAGFHTGVGGNQTGIGDLYYKKLAARRIPFVMMAADGFPAEAQALAAADPQTRHFVGYRRTGAVDSAANRLPPSNDPNVPRYGIPAQQASDEHWAWHTAFDILPAEYNGAVTYLLTINEPNKDDDVYVEWLADVEYYNCQKALAAGFRYAVFGWAGGTPEPRHWRGPNMLRLLALIKANPERLAVAIHEYSWTEDTIWTGITGDNYSLVGRAHSSFLKDHPTLPFVITEFGWAERDAPTDVARAIREIREVAELYARYPNYLGAAIWYLGPGFDTIHNTVNTYIGPLADEIINHPIEVDATPPPPPPPPPVVSGDGKPRVQYARNLYVLPQATTVDRFIEVARAAFNEKRTVGFSYDDAGIGELADKTAVLYDLPASEQATFRSWYETHYPGTKVEFRPTATQPPPTAVQLVYRPCDTDRVTQPFGVNPADYAEFGLPGHEGVDYGVGAGLPFYAAAAGTVVHASDRRWSNVTTPSDYGWHVVIDHGDYCTVYAHAKTPLPVQVGQNVAAGQVVGYSGNTGHSHGYHLHFSIFDQSGKIDPGNGYPVWKYGRPVNPAPFLAGKLPPPAVGGSGEMVNVLPFLRGRDKVQFDLDYGAGTQTTQVRHLPDDRWLYVKGSNGEYECFALRLHNGVPWIFRAEDTSESATRLYAHWRSQGGTIGAPWVPATMEVGKWYETSKFVQHYTKTLLNGVWQGACTPANSGQVVDKIRLLKRPYQRTYASGKVLSVVTLEWSSGEQYDFCSDFGNVGFRDSSRNFWFMDGPLNGRADKPFVKPAIAIGW